MVLSTTAILVLNHKTPCTQMLFSPLFLLMPRKLWLFKLYCHQQGFNIVELTSVEIYNTVRQVLDVNRYYTIHYTIAGRTLKHVFSVCKNRMISWNQMIVRHWNWDMSCSFPAFLLSGMLVTLK